MVRGGQAQAVPQLGEAERRGAAAVPGVQVLPGHQQPDGLLVLRQRRVRRADGGAVRQGVREDRPDAAVASAAADRGPEPGGLHVEEEQREDHLQGHGARQSLRADSRPAVRGLHLPVLRADSGLVAAGHDARVGAGGSTDTAEQVSDIPRHGDGDAAPDPAVHAQCGQGVHRIPVHGGGGEGPDSALPDGAPGPQQREHRGLQQQEVLAA